MIRTTQSFVENTDTMGQREISTKTLRDWLDSGKKVNVLDVRPLNEREEWKIPGSIHVDVYSELKKNNPKTFKSMEWDKSIPVVTVCAGGKTSLIAAKMLQNSGYEAYSLQGGMRTWRLSWNTADNAFDGFKIIQFRRTGKGCLSYLIISLDEALVIDASLPVEVYQDHLDQNRLNLKYATDTHIHADHLSRTKELAEKNGNKPSIPANDKLKYPFNSIADGDIISLGKIKVRAIGTPGHTFESTSYLIDNKVLLTGDTLFTNGVGRPDLKADREEADKKAIMLYYSIRKLIRLDGSIIVMPGHTSQPVAFDHQPIQSSLKDIMQDLPLLKKDEQEFIQYLLKRIPDPPENYLKIVEKNISGDFKDINTLDLEVGANR
ncbi:MAG: rhodanese-like domain-containing protein [Cyclobacteriaceae bacterium]